MHWFLSIKLIYPSRTSCTNEIRMQDDQDKLVLRDIAGKEKLGDLV